MRSIALCVCVVSVVGVVLYYMSDRFRLAVGDAVTSANEWSPTEIARDPQGYVRFALAKLDDADTKLVARRIELRKIASGLRRAGEHARQKADDRERRIAELNDAETLVSMPPSSGSSRQLTSTEVRAIIDRDQPMIAVWRAESERHFTALSQVDRELDQLEKGRHDLSQKRAELLRKREFLAIDMALSEIEAIRLNVDELVGSVDALLDDDRRLPRIEDITSESVVR